MQFKEEDIEELLFVCRTSKNCSMRVLRKLLDYQSEYSCDENLARTNTYPNLY